MLKLMFQGGVDKENAEKQGYLKKEGIDNIDYTFLFLTIFFVLFEAMPTQAFFKSFLFLFLYI